MSPLQVIGLSQQSAQNVRAQNVRAQDWRYVTTLRHLSHQEIPESTENMQDEGEQTESQEITKQRVI